MKLISYFRHSDVKEFECNECGKQFKRKDKLKEHAKRMHHSTVSSINFQPQISNEMSVSSKIGSAGDNPLLLDSKTSPLKMKKNLKKKSQTPRVETQSQSNEKVYESPTPIIMDLSANKEKVSVDSNSSSSKGPVVALPTVPPPSSKRHVPKVPATDYERFTFKCHQCLLGFKRRGMLVNHLVKRHPETPLSSVNELNMPILKPSKDYYCQYCNKVYKSSSKRKVHILKNHPGAPLPLSARETNGEAANGLNGPDPTYSATVGSITLQPHRCKQCHRQYASNAKLLQHQRKKHQSNIPNLSSGSSEKSENITTDSSTSDKKETNKDNTRKARIEDLADEWDIFTAGTSKSSNSSSKGHVENKPGNSTQSISLADNGRIPFNHEEEEDDGGVALQYIVHDNGDLEVVQRAMPSASFSDRRSVDTPLPPEEIPTSHPDAMECANPSRFVTQTEAHNSKINTNASSSINPRIYSKASEEGHASMKYVSLTSPAVNIEQGPSTKPRMPTQNQTASNAISQPMGVQFESLTPEVQQSISHLTNVSRNNTHIIPLTSAIPGGQISNKQKMSSRNEIFKDSSSPSSIQPQANVIHFQSYQPVSVNPTIIQPPTTDGNIQINRSFYNLKPLVSDQLPSRNASNVVVNLSSGPSSLSINRQPSIQENLVTVNADHIAPISNQHSSKLRQGKKILPQTTPQQQSIFPNPATGGQSANQMRQNDRNENNITRQPSSRDEAERKTERELTEWLNDAYKRKR